MVEDVSQVKALNEQLAAMGSTTANVRRQADFLKVSWNKVKHTIADSFPVLGHIIPVATWVGNLSKVATVFSDDAKDMEEATNALTTAQKYLIMPLIKASAAAKAGAAMNEIFRDSAMDSEGGVRGWVLALMKLTSILFTIVSIVGIVGFAFATFSLATQGASSPLIALAQDHAPWLVESLKGIANLLSGDFSNMLQIAKGVALLFVAAMLTLPTFVGPLVVAIMIAVGVFRYLRDEGLTLWEAIGVAGAVAFGSLIAMLNSGVIIKLFLRLLWWILGWVGTGTLLILGGLALLAKAAMGEFTDFWANIAIGVGAAMVYIGLIIMNGLGLIGVSILGLPLFWVAALLGIVALVIRYKDTIVETFMGWGDAIWVAAQSLGKRFIDGFLSLIPDWIVDFFTGGSSAPSSSAGSRGYGETATYSSTSAMYEARALGGSVRGGRTYLVGERGPELFSPRSSGHITPNDKLGGGVTNNINLSIDVGGVTDRTDKRALAREISDMLSQEMRRLGGSPTRGRY